MYYMADFYRFQSAVKCYTILCRIPARNYHADISVLYEPVSRTYISKPLRVHFDMEGQTDLRDSFHTDQFSSLINKIGTSDKQSDV